MPVKAVFHTGLIQPWTASLGDIPWPLLPVGNRPFLEYWFEACIDLGIKDVRLILGEGAEYVETYAGEGAQWGLSITYSFLKEGKSPDSFLTRSPKDWEGGLFYLRTPVFLNRLSEPGVVPRFPGGTFVHQGEDGVVNGLISDNPEFVRAYIGTPKGAHAGSSFSTLNIWPSRINSVKEYYDLNMSVVGAGAKRYLRPGYSLKDDVSIGFNVVLPPSVTVTPPVAIGNNCRLGAMTSVGPLAVVGNHAIIDRQTELSECVILDGTYVGRGLEIRGKIVVGNRLVDPESGMVAEINDPLLVAPVRSVVQWADTWRAVFGWLCAVLLVLLQVVPFFVLYPYVKIFRKGRFRNVSVHLTRRRVGTVREFVPCSGGISGIGKLFQVFNLDLFPAFCAVVRGQVWLCGVKPMRSPEEDSLRLQLNDYFPGVIVYDSDERDYAEPGGHLAHALFYARFRSFFDDVKMILGLFISRPLHFLSGCAPNER
jgi:hypothetical protein